MNHNLRQHRALQALAYAALWALCIGITMLMLTATGHALVEAIRGLS